MRVLIIEDDPVIAANLYDYLESRGHVVDAAHDGVTGLHLAVTYPFDGILLDLGLPGMDGGSMCRRLREEAQIDTPVLMVTARDTLEDKLKGFDQGADDYLVKPFDPKELLARMRAVVRRKSGSGAPLLVCGALSLDPATHEAEYQGTCVRLSGREFALLEALVRRPGAIVPKGDLEQKIYGWGQEADSNTVEVLVYGLRRKLGSGVIRTVRGVGYMVDARG